MVPTLTATLGVKGHRPTVPTRDCKDLLYVFAVVNLVSAALHTNTLESPHDAKKRTGLSKTRGIQTSRSAVQRFCSKIGIRLYRPTYHYERGDPQKQARAQEDLAELGIGRRPVTSSC